MLLAARICYATRRFTRYMPGAFFRLILFFLMIAAAFRRRLVTPAHTPCRAAEMRLPRRPPMSRADVAATRDEAARARCRYGIPVNKGKAYVC